MFHRHLVNITLSVETPHYKRGQIIEALVYSGSTSNPNFHYIPSGQQTDLNTSSGIISFTCQNVKSKDNENNVMEVPVKDDSLEKSESNSVFIGEDERRILEVDLVEHSSAKYLNNGRINDNVDDIMKSDRERKFYQVETLAEQLEKERNMNLTPISEFHSKSNSIKKTIEFIESEHKNGLKSTYNTSENELNSFGYELMNARKENEALEIFTLNTKLYPLGFNTFDSLGECLLLLGKKDEGIKEYKKSLELNSKNENARKIIKENK